MSESDDHTPPADDIEEAAPAVQSPVGVHPRMAVGMPVESAKDFKNSSRRLVARLGNERPLVLLVLALTFGSVTLAVIGPRLLGDATNIVVNGVISRKGVDFTKLGRTILEVVALYLCSASMQLTQGRVLTGVVQRSMYRLREDVETKLNDLPLSYFDRVSRGDLLSRVTNDIDNLGQSMQQTLSQVLQSSLMIIGVLIMMVSISPILAAIAVLTVPVALFSIRQITRRSKQKFMAQWTHTGVLNAQVEETFTGHALVQVFGRTHDVAHRFNDKNEELFEASFWAQFISSAVQPAMMFLGNLNYVAIAAIGGVRVVNGQMTIGDIQAFIQYSRQFTQPLTQLAAMVNVMQSGIASAERVFELLDVEVQPPDPVDALELTSPQGYVEFDHIRFAYDPKKPLISDLSLVAKPGATVAIVGPTGAGKTTLVNLLMRFYDIQDGRICLDGRDTAQLRRADVRSAMGMVLQDTWLFEGTIRENIAFGNPDATEEQILEAARATHVDAFVRSLPKGYDTVIDDEGTSVSAGEKQLLTIARAFLADPTILILDEATSSVDTRTELLIQKAMGALRAGRTSFVIAHRLSTIRDADTILVMEHGDIVEQGNHHELLEKGGAYAALYNSQFAGAAVDLDYGMT